MSDIHNGTCESCMKTFRYWLLHSGFGECSYAYCDRCGMTADFSHWDERFPKIRTGFGEIPAEMEPFARQCTCGGSFIKGAQPRCPHCNRNLSAETATKWIEANAPGAKKGWRWQADWTGIYAIVIEEKRLRDHFR